MFCLIHTQNDWKGSMFPRKSNRLYCSSPGLNITTLIKTGKQVTQ